MSGVAGTPVIEFAARGQPRRAAVDRDPAQHRLHRIFIGRRFEDRREPVAHRVP